MAIKQTTIDYKYNVVLRDDNFNWNIDVASGLITMQGVSPTNWKAGLLEGEFVEVFDPNQTVSLGHGIITGIGGAEGDFQILQITLAEGAQAVSDTYSTDVIRAEGFHIDHEEALQIPSDEAWILHYAIQNNQFVSLSGRLTNEDGGVIAGPFPVKPGTDPVLPAGALLSLPTFGRGDAILVYDDGK